MRSFHAVVLLSLVAVALDPACGGTVSNDSSDPERYGGDATGPGGYAGSPTGTGGAATAFDASVESLGGAAQDAGPDALVPLDSGLVDGGGGRPLPDAALDAPTDAAADAVVDATPDSVGDAAPPVAVGFWQELSVIGPSPRWGHGLAYDGARERVVLFGGWPGPNSVIDSETWEWDGVQWELVAPVGAGPRAWIYFGMAYDAARELTVVHGGYTNQVMDACGAVDHSSATWGWDGTEWVLLSCEGPAARGLALAYDSERDRMVTVTGYPSSADTWEWDGEHWELITSEGPPPRTNYALSYDAGRARVVLYGGSAGEAYGDTWEWDGAVWELAAQTGPPPAQNAAMAYFAGAVQQTVLFVNGETWQWDGSEWTYVATANPSPRENAAMTYDAGARDIMMFGGDALPSDGHQNLGDTWIYGVSPSLQ